MMIAHTYLHYFVIILISGVVMGQAKLKRLKTAQLCQVRTIECLDTGQVKEWGAHLTAVEYSPDVMRWVKEGLLYKVFRKETLLRPVGSFTEITKIIYYIGGMALFGNKTVKTLGLLRHNMVGPAQVEYYGPGNDPEPFIEYCYRGLDYVVSPVYGNISCDVIAEAAICQSGVPNDHFVWDGIETDMFAVHYRILIESAKEGKLSYDNLYNIMKGD